MLSRSKFSYFSYSPYHFSQVFHTFLQGLSVIDVPCREHEIQYLSFIIDYQM